MTIALPVLPRGATTSPTYVDFSARSTPPAGGAAITILRPGRMGCAVDIPPLDADCAGQWLAAQLEHKATGQPVRLTLRPPKGQPSIIGVAADGGNIEAQPGGGTMIPVSGAPGVVLKKGYLFSLSSGATSQLYMVTNGGTFPAGGGMNITISPMLRALPPDGTPLNFNDPTIEGNLDPGNLAWTLQRLRWIGVSFNITEIL